MNRQASEKKILITGGAGFIGSHVFRTLFTSYTAYKIYNLYALTYVGNLGNIWNIDNSSNYILVKN